MTPWKRRTGLAILLLSLCVYSIARASDAQLQAVIDDHWAYTLSQNPVFATSQGVRDYDGQLADLSVQAMDDRKAAYQSFLKRLDDIAPDQLSANAELNHQLLRQDLRTDVAALSYPQRLMIFNRLSGWHIALASLPDRIPLTSLADYESYIARLTAFAAQNSQAIATTKEAIRQGMTQPCAALEGYDRTISGQITTQPEQSRLWAPFKTRPGAISQAQWNDLRVRARQAIGDRVMPSLRSWLAFYRSDYVPVCRKDIGARGLKQGEAFYAHRIKRYTTTDTAARQIHQIGLSEVSRIRREMRSIMDQVKFTGRFQEFQDFLRTDPRFYAKTGDELLAKTALIAKRADGELPKLFSRLPRMTYTVKPIPREVADGNVAAYYERASGDGTRAGVFRINLSQLDQRPLYELEALTLHEAVPGHHLQLALQQELEDIPNFRRFGGQTAYIEGWGLYSERLGQEMGFYEDPYSNFGRLSLEMWRACRLVVDTGIHALGWGRQRAIDFMLDNTALSETNIRAEVDRYITWPGQALAYKIGELKFRALRKLASEALQDSFDIRSFHDALLAQGALPLNILEERMRDYIRAQGGKLPERQDPSRGNAERRVERQPVGNGGERPRR
ncbi:MAG: DUF885 domain-containing protein [Pseudomonadota bacterium]